MTLLGAFVCQLTSENWGTHEALSFRSANCQLPRCWWVLFSFNSTDRGVTCAEFWDGQFCMLGSGYYHSYWRKWGLRKGKCFTWDRKSVLVIRTHINKVVPSSHSQELTKLLPWSPTHVHAQSHPTLCDHMDCRPPWITSDSLASLALQAGSFRLAPPGKPLVTPMVIDKPHPTALFAGPTVISMVLT